MNSGLLTIDDFPSKNTPAIVDYLKEKNINLFAPDIRKLLMVYGHGLRHIIKQSGNKAVVCYDVPFQRHKMQRGNQHKIRLQDRLCR